jgi:Flp pilus assembly protein CpaB
MRRRLFLIIGLMLLIVAGLVFAWTRIRATPARTAEPTPQLPTEVFSVVFAAQDIPAGTFVSQENITLGPWPTLYRLEGLVTDPTTVVGLRARLDIKRGEPIFSTQVAESLAGMTVAGSDMALDMAPGKLAIAMPMSRLAGVAFAPQRGDHVAVIGTLLFLDLDPDFQSSLPNKIQVFSLTAEGKIEVTTVEGGRNFSEAPLSNAVLATYDVPSEAQRARPVSAIVIPDARVLAVGTVQAKSSEQAVAEQGVGAPNSETTAATTPAAPDIIVLEVLPQEALALNLIMKTGGDLTFALRATGDTSALDLPSWDLQRLITERNISLPPKLPYGQANFKDQLFIPELPGDQPVGK